jgi:hypothetical protein
MSEHQKIEALSNLIAAFGDRRHHLAKFLVESKAVSDAFLRGIDAHGHARRDDFVDISEIEAHFAALVGAGRPGPETDLDGKLSRLISEEKYEDAARLRDYIAKIRRRG